MQKKSPVKAASASLPAKSLAKSNGGARAFPKEIKAAATTPSREEIARRAYEIYVARGRAGGHETEDWVQAERELSARVHRRN
jgi:hypothetical protein